MEQAIEAAREVIARKDPKVSRRDARRHGHPDPAAATRSSAASSTRPTRTWTTSRSKQGNERNVKAAFERAGYLLYELTPAGGMQDDPAQSRAWERFLPIAVDQFGRKEFAFDYAMRLQAKNPPKYAEAVKYFRMVPADDKRLRRRRGTTR